MSSHADAEVVLRVVSHAHHPAWLEWHAAEDLETGRLHELQHGRNLHTVHRADHLQRQTRTAER